MSAGIAVGDKIELMSQERGRKPMTPSRSLSAGSDGVRPDSATEEAVTAENRLSESTEQAPTTTILFFDGICGLCNRFVDFLLTRDTAEQIQFSPLQGETARQRLNTSDTQDLTTVVLLDERGQHRRSTAVVRVLMRLGGIWKIVAGLLWLIPRPIRDLGYRIAAGNRYWVFGKKETCRMPSPQERQRFLP